jgi:hypothetical protein
VPEEASKTELPCKFITANCSKTWTPEGVGGTLNLPKKRGWGKEINSRVEIPVKKHSGQTISKPGQVVDYRADLLNQRAGFKTELPHLTAVAAG